MEDKKVERNNELLFEYLRSILYDSKVKTIDVDELDEPFRKLGLGLQYLEKALAEMKEYSAALSTGNLSVEVPPRDNLLCENLKNIHANLNHLTWQVKQVAKGDYTQTVSYLGEFSEAFNRMISQLDDREQKLVDEANIDTLTGIGNRAFFYRIMQELLARQEAMVLCFCDLDNLKFINDRHGHEEGDYYIMHFVDTVRRGIRADDVFVRIGGDEFCIVLRGCSIEVATAKICRMQRQFSDDPGKTYAQEFSFGIVEIPAGSNDEEFTELLNKADELMYVQKQKQKHKNRDIDGEE